MFYSSGPPTGPVQRLLGEYDCPYVDKTAGLAGLGKAVEEVMLRDAATPA